MKKFHFLLGICMLFLLMQGNLMAQIAPYCNPICNDGGYELGFSRVRLIGESSTIDNISAVPTAAGCSGGSYYTVEDYTGVGSADLLKGNTYNLEVTTGAYCAGATHEVYVWIDWNGDDVFSDRELIMSNLTVPISATTTLSFTVPREAQIGTTRMRVLADDIQSLTRPDDIPDPCIMKFGEMEDYALEVVCGTPNSVTSATTTQASTQELVAGTINQPILRMEVTIAGNCGGLSVDQLDFNTTGSSAPGTDLSYAKVFYTGLSSTFTTYRQLGVTTSGPAGAFSVDVSAEGLSLQNGTYYFWLTYDIANTATTLNTVDGECTNITLAAGTNTPVVTAPAGSRTLNFSTYTVNANNNTDDGTCDGAHCSLHEAIDAANADGGKSFINFAIPGACPQSIVMTSQLPSLTEDWTVIDGYTQSGATPNSNSTGALNGTLCVVLNGAIVNSGIKVRGSNCTVKGMVLPNFLKEGVYLTDLGDSNSVLGCYIGMDASGTTASNATEAGVRISQGVINNTNGHHVIGDGSPENRNLIAGTKSGTGTSCIHVDSSGNYNTIRGNIIGLQADGATVTPIKSRYGIWFGVRSGGGNMVGGSRTGHGNVISGLDQYGIYENGKNGRF